MTNRAELERRAREYGQKVGKGFGAELGFGVHGIVFTLKNDSGLAHSAIKVFEQERFYRRERNVYLRLAEEHIDQVRGCTVPELLGHDDDLWIVEMTLVAPPYLLDFAGAFLDLPPDEPDEV